VVYVDDQGRMSSGAVVHRAPKVIGISNVFGVPDWLQPRLHASATFPLLDTSRGFRWLPRGPAGDPN
jgi:hypothetical protein